MKSIIQITSRLLTAYLIALPILFSYHMLRHQHDENFNQQDGHEITQLTSRCDLCDLYHTQIASFDNEISYHTQLPLIFSEQYFYAYLASIDNDLIYLRGPPKV